MTSCKPFTLFIIFSIILIPLFTFAKTADENPAEEVFGKNFKLSVDPTSGTLSYNFSEKTNELESIIAKMDVHLVSDKLSLDCDEFNFYAATRKVDARGKRVSIVQETISSTCGHFIYDPNTGRSELLIDPIINNRDPKGQETTTSGDKIIIEKQTNGDTLIQVEGHARLFSGKGSETTPQFSQAPEPTQKMFGNEFEILTGENGEILYAFSQKNELRSIVARKDVYITSDQINLRCDRLEYFSRKNKLLAMGKPVKIFQQSILAECGRFEYYPTEGKSILLENPVILSEDEDGKTLETRGEEITIIQLEEGRTSILVKGKPEITAEEPQEEEPEEEPAKISPSPVDETTVDLIKNLDIMQD